MTSLLDFLQTHPTIWETLKLLLMTVVTTVAVWVLLWLERKASARLMEKRKNMNMRFVESIVRFVVIFLAAQWVIMSSPITQPFGKVLFQGTTVIAAIAGFAAQPVIADMICGLMISSTQPFDIGDRIELEDGTAGIVKDITLRHVTIHDVETMLVIPNSKLNGMRVRNMSYHSPRRSVHMRFSVAYDTDVKQAMAVIGKAVRESPCTIPGREGKNGLEYSPVYFIQYEDSSLQMLTTVYFDKNTPTEVVKSDVNTRVKQALNENGIEIPYNYLNVVMDEQNQS